MQRPGGYVQEIGGLMLTPVFTTRFKKDMKRILARGCESENIKNVMRDLIAGKPLDRKCRDHILIGNFNDRRECHIESDWLLIYRFDESRIIFERTGTHADLFR